MGQSAVIAGVGEPRLCEPFPGFHPHSLVRGGHAQTLLGYWCKGRLPAYRATPVHVLLEDGDAIVLHDDCPDGWSAGDAAALLVHGLAGCHLSPYMIRIAAKLNDRGWRVFRMDLRGCGAGWKLAQKPYHAGASGDVLAALREIERLCPGSPFGIAGFSLGANIVLKLLGEAPSRAPDCVTAAVAVNPPVDLAESVACMGRWSNRPYDRFFTRLLTRHVEARHVEFDRPPPWKTRPRDLYEFDDVYTAPQIGFGSADEYYARCSANQFIGDVAVPTLLLAARNDPMVPISSIERLVLPDCVDRRVAASGGHLGYLARRGSDPDRRWMDWRVVEWLGERPQAASSNPPSATK